MLTLDDALALADVRNETVLIAEAGVRRARGVEAQVAQPAPAAADRHRVLRPHPEVRVRGHLRRRHHRRRRGRRRQRLRRPAVRPAQRLPPRPVVLAADLRRRPRARARAPGAARPRVGDAVGRARPRRSSRSTWRRRSTTRRWPIASSPSPTRRWRRRRARSSRPAPSARPAWSRSSSCCARRSSATRCSAPRVRAGNNRDVAYFRLKQLVDLPLGDADPARRGARRSAAAPRRRASRPGSPKPRRRRRRACAPPSPRRTSASRRARQA